MIDDELHSAARLLLRKAWSKIEDPENWCQRHNADNGQGKSVLPWDDQAKRFCMVGVVYAIAGEESTERSMTVRGYMIDLLNTAAEELFPLFALTQINDTLGHYAVRKVFVKALSL